MIKPGGHYYIKLSPQFVYDQDLFIRNRWPHDSLSSTIKRPSLMTTKSKFLLTFQIFNIEMLKLFNYENLRKYDLQKNAAYSNRVPALHIGQHMFPL